MGLIVSSMLPHNLHLLFCRVLSIHCFDMNGSYGVVLAAICRDFISLLKFPFLNHIHFFRVRCFAYKSLKTSIWLFSHFSFLVTVVLLVLLL